MCVTSGSVLEKLKLKSLDFYFYLFIFARDVPNEAHIAECHFFHQFTNNQYIKCHIFSLSYWYHLIFILMCGGVTFVFEIPHTFVGILDASSIYKLKAFECEQNSSSYVMPDVSLEVHVSFCFLSIGICKHCHSNLIGGLLQMEMTLQDHIWEHLLLSGVRIGTKALSVTFLIK